MIVLLVIKDGCYNCYFLGLNDLFFLGGVRQNLLLCWWAKGVCETPTQPYWADDHSQIWFCPQLILKKTKKKHVCCRLN